MALDYDFWISGLGFNTAIGTDRPYERATAQFRKDQADTTATVGDQSLTGWWTRGQLSFHKGAGVKYYEVLGNEDDTIEGRFRSSEGVDVWTPGEVSIYPGFSTVSQLPGDMVTATVDTPSGTDRPGVYVLTASGGLRSYEPVEGVNDTTNLATGVVSITSDTNTLFFSIGTSIRGRNWTAGGGFTDYWTPNTSETWGQVFSVKGRVLAVTTSGRWYQLVGGGRPAVDADIFWESDFRIGEDWSVAESPGAIYLARAQRVYALVPDSDGLLPTLTAPTQAAELPNGETIAAIGCYLGYLVMATNRGVRVALVNPDASVTLGPIVVKGDFSAKRIAAWGNLVYVTGVLEDETDASLVALDLTTLVASLLPAWVRLCTLASTVGEAHGVLTMRDDTLVVGDADGLHPQASTLSAKGTLTTGFHRLGTLEPKAFRLLRVKTEGTEGDIDVTANTPDGTTYTVGTVAAGATEEFDLATVTDFPSSLEYLSVTFTLNRGATTGPTLLGYQLKALPVPKRQRMIRVPLMLMDSEQNRRGQTTHGRRPGVTDPWTRLAALEDLEQSNAVVTFEDRLTGETGSAYIESVEVSRTSNSDFGGFVYVTLRLV